MGPLNIHAVAETPEAWTLPAAYPSRKQCKKPGRAWVLPARQPAERRWSQAFLMTSWSGYRPSHRMQPANEQSSKGPRGAIKSPRHSTPWLITLVLQHTWTTLNSREARLWAFLSYPESSSGADSSSKYERHITNTGILRRKNSGGQDRGRRASEYCYGNRKKMKSDHRRRVPSRPRPVPHTQARCQSGRRVPLLITRRILICQHQGGEIPSSHHQCTMGRLEVIHHRPLLYPLSPCHPAKTPLA